MLISDIMTKEVHCVDKESFLLDAAILMAKEKISGLLVTENDGEIVGVLSEEDLFPRIKVQDSLNNSWPMLYSEWAGEDDLEDYLSRAAELPVKEIMSKDVESISSSEQVTRAAIKMANNSFKRLPVVDDGTLVGIVTASDIISEMLRISNQAKSDAKYKVA